jgi:serine/threonine-protein kinase PknG
VPAASPPSSTGRIAERAERDPALRTVESALWLCRAYLAAGDDLRADAWLGVARERSGDYDWRIFWHSGLVRLTRGLVEEAEGEFAATYAALPGEAAPKLALGYCAEYLAGRMREAALAGPVTERDRTARQPATVRRVPRDGEEQPAGRALARERQAEEYYEAVWRRDRTQGSAAFGLARIHLGRGDRSRAVAVLDEVPTTSRHYDAARVAAIRALAGPLPGGQPPRVGGLVEAAERVAGLYLDDSGSRDRLVTELREYALVCRPPGGWGAGFPAGGLFGAEDTPDALRALLSRSLKRLAEQAREEGPRGDLLDLAYAVLPEPAGLRELLWSRRRRRRAETSRRTAEA